MNPPTKGHSILIDHMVKKSLEKEFDHVVFLSQTSGNKKNPLSWEFKREVCLEAYPGVNFSNNTQINNPYQALEQLIAEGYTDIQLVVGSDRELEFDSMGAYSEMFGVEFGIESCSLRTDNTDSVSGISASIVRDLAKEDKDDLFRFWLLPGLRKITQQRILEIVKEVVKLP